MIVGRIIGKTTTNRFRFKIESKVKKYDYVQVWHKEYEYVYGQIVEITLSEKQAIGDVIVLGYLANNTLKPIKYPLAPNSEVLKVKESDIKKFLRINPDGLYIGLLRDTEVEIKLDVNKLITKHLAVLAKTGAGKSYSVGVILEELLKKGIPSVVIDTHGEYFTLTQPNDDPEDIKRMPRFKVKPRAYRNIQHYGHPITKSIPLTIKDSFTIKQILKILPKLSSTQQTLLFEAIHGNDAISLKELLFNLSALESNKKYSLITLIEELINSNVFSDSGIPYNEIVQTNKLSIIDLKGFSPRIQEVIVYKLLSDLFELRKINKIPPLFLVIEESHNFCPERNFGEKITSEIIRTIASEGRKFGVGLCVVSQRPSRIDKNVLSQCNTQIIQKITNPNDLKAIMQSVEGIYEGADDEIKNLPIGNALISGVLDVPIIVEIRPRETKHGGKTTLMELPEVDVKKELEEFNQKEILPLILPKITEKDYKLMFDKDPKKVLYPVVLFECKDKKKYKLLFELINGRLIYDIDFFKTKRLPDLKELSVQEIKILEKAYYLKTFTFEEIAQQVNLLDVKNILRSLVNKKYLIYERGHFKLNDEVVLSRLDHYSITQTFNYLSINYDKKLSPQISVDSIKEHLSNFTEIIKHELGFLLVFQ